MHEGDLAKGHEEEADPIWTDSVCAGDEQLEQNLVAASE